MLKRYQVLIDDWQADHYKSIAAKYDVSFSEMIRMALCIDIMYATRVVFPQYKWSVDMRMLEKAIKKHDIVGTIGIEKFHSFLSKLYFEVRKATELWARAGNAGKKRIGKHFNEKR
ncbi:MAG: hypothetical protein JSW40_01330 [Candidatus Omnitrophota bacterium]|nr:MAG: hypothetical protein JSW40_01330 [Candidatus Omnitrophota bacterium]